VFFLCAIETTSLRLCFNKLSFAFRLDLPWTMVDASSSAQGSRFLSSSMTEILFFNTEDLF
jgi:hypothetical protein